MTSYSQIEQRLMTHMESGMRDVQLCRFLREKANWQQRDSLMHHCGFPDPARNPVSAYVSFENAILRIDRQLRREGQRIERSDGWLRIVGAA